MIHGLCFGFKNCMKLSIIQQRQAPVTTHVLKAAFSKHVLTELRHFYIIALLYQPRIPRFFCQTHKKLLNCLAGSMSKINPKGNSIPQGYSELFLGPKAHGETKKNIFLYLPTSIYYLSYSIYTQDPLDIVNPSSMQDTCHMRT